MYFEIFALLNSSAAATVHRQKHFADEGSFADDTLTDSSRRTCRRSAVSKTKIQREKSGAAAVRRGGSAAAPLGVNRFTSAEVGLEGFIIERILHFDASTGR